MIRQPDSGWTAVSRRRLLQLVGCMAGSGLVLTGCSSSELDGKWRVVGAAGPGAVLPEGRR